MAIPPKTINKPPSKTPQTPGGSKTVKGPFHFQGRIFHAIFICSVVIFSFILYGNGISNGFSLDDEFVLHGDTAVQKGAKGISGIFKKRYAWDQKGSYGYRPMVEVTYALEYSLFKDSPHPGHVINILMYALLCIFLFYLLRKIFYYELSDYFLLIALALFIFHPLHTEVVDSLKNRDEMMVFLLGFYSVWAWIKCFEIIKSPNHQIIKSVLLGLSGCITLVLGILCKRDAILFIPVTGLTLYFYGNSVSGVNKLKNPIIAMVSMSLMLKIFARFLLHNFLPATSYHRTFTYVENPLVGVHWYQKIPLAFSSFSFYTGKLVFPKDLVCYYGFDAFNAFPKWTDFSVMAGILLMAGFFYIIYINRKRVGTIHESSLLFILLLFGGTIFPYLNLFQMGPGIVAERFMFIPSVGFVLLVTYLLFYVLKLNPAQGIQHSKSNTQHFTYALGITAVICFIFTMRVIARNPDWKSHQSVYKHDVEVAPRSAKLQSLLAATYIEQAQRLRASRNAAEPQNAERIDSLFKAGEDAYLKSVEIYSGYGTSWNNLGMIQYTLYKNLDKGIEYFKKALAIDSGYTEALFNLGASFAAKADKCHDSLEARAYNDSSERFYLLTIKTKPNYNMAYIYLSKLYFAEKEYDKSIQLNKTALANGNASDVVYINLGNGYLVKKDSADAVQCYVKALNYYDKNYYLCEFLAKYYFKRGELDSARKYKEMYKQAMQYQRKHEPQN